MKYRIIKRLIESQPTGTTGYVEHYIVFVVQVKGFIFWHDVKTFSDQEDPAFAEREAEELLEILEAK